MIDICGTEKMRSMVRCVYTDLLDTMAGNVLKTTQIFQDAWWPTDRDAT
jgi:hypothetical protein